MSASIKNLLDPALTAQEATALFRSSSFLILSPSATATVTASNTYTLDASPYLTPAPPSSSSNSINRFEGFKLLPDGFHLLTLTADDAIAVQGVIRFTQGHQVFIRSANTLLPPDQPGSDPGTELPTVFSPDPIARPKQPQTVTSLNHLATLDPHLVPYPATTHSVWKKATLHLHDPAVGPSAVAKVCGVDEWAGDVRIDSLIPLHDPQPQGTGVDSLLSSSGREQRAAAARESQAEKDLDDQLRRGGSSHIACDTGSTTSGLRFTTFDMRRSWKSGTVGSELTRWSVDKSWLLGQTIQRAGGVSHLLAEFELAFVMLHRLHAPAALTQWLSLLSLFSRSAYACSRAPSHFEAPASSSVDSHGRSMPMSTVETETEREIKDQVEPDAHTRFLDLLLAQLQLVVVHASVSSSFAHSDSRARHPHHDEDAGEQEEDEAANDPNEDPPGVDFFNNLDPDLEAKILRELSTLRAGISSGFLSSASTQGTADPRKTARASSSGSAQGRDSPEALLAAWRRLSHFSSRHLGWSLDEELDEEVQVREELEEEEGEDAPVVVEVEDEYDYDEYA
ncbi:hypothetical protein OC846_001187 [Tilletia horrida]|uniref:A1 cistron-splicing factor AAR2 n=1 Tax=Tilletia horrida TaxID=155126 RepID=A0AAN6GU56_9BASI|nr:hypothetical protein OC846_001187 [Tilletia horrida]KAK0569263.1 hypothetical protein OC861_001078 [Tilletia horrida]